MADDTMVSEAVLPLTAAIALRDNVAVEDNDAARYGDGYREGFEAGEADGAREAQVRLEQLEAELRARHDEAEASYLQARDRWNELATGFADAERARIACVQEDAFEVALLALAAAFGDGLDDRERIGRLVAQVVSDYRADALCLHVAEADRPLLPDHIDGVRIEGRADMAPGSCALLTTRGRMETSIEHRLEAIHRSMVSALQGLTP